MRKDSRSGQDINHTHVNFKSLKLALGIMVGYDLSALSRTCSDQPCFQNDVSHFCLGEELGWGV